MKSEHRHELQTNYLADKLGLGLQQIQPIAQWVLGGLIAVLVGLVGWMAYKSFSQQSSSEAWTEYYFNLSTRQADSFTLVAERFPGTTAASWARQTAGDENLAAGIDALYRDRSQAKKLLTDAIEGYEIVERQAGNSDLKNRAILGLAQAHESMGDLEKAKKYYSQLTSADMQRELLELTESRLAFLESDAGKQFYTWFEQLKPQPALPPSMPSNLSTPPTSPDLKFEPVIPNSTAPAGQTATPSLELDLTNLPPLPGAAPANEPSVPAAETPTVPGKVPDAPAAPAESTQP